MPRGAHFKKPNPRIIQVSFKVNATEHEKLLKLAAAGSQSIPEWLRQQIDKNAGSVEHLPSPVKEQVVEEPAPKPLKEKRAVKEEVKIAPNQMSLF